MVFFIANSGEPKQTPHFAVSDLDPHCLPMSHKKDARLISVKTVACDFWNIFSDSYVSVLHIMNYN